MNEYGSFAKETANNLDITTSTLRRWSIALEKAGYQFRKNDKNQRIYYERDYKSLREMKSLLKSGRMFDECVSAIVARVDHEEKTLGVFESNEDEVRLSKRELQEMLNEAALQAVDAYSDKMQNDIEVRDRRLMEHFNTLSQSAATLEEPDEQSKVEEDQKQRPWWKFWAKD